MQFEGNGTIKIAIIVGSIRKNNFSLMAAKVLNQECINDKKISVSLIDPSELKLPLPGQEGDFPDVGALQRRIKEATGVIMVTPEYHGGLSSVIKLIIENMGFPSALKSKPIALAGVASGHIGAIKSLEMLRSICSHVGGIVLPGPVSVADVHTVFDENGKILDTKIENRLKGVVQYLRSFIEEHICPKMELEAMVRD